METQTHDLQGNPVFPVQINTIAPIEHAEDARQLSFEFLQSLGGDDSLESMLPVLLRPIGEQEATHVYCGRSSFTHELNLQLNFLNQQNEEWVSGNLETNPEIILQKFCTFEGTLDSVGLEVC